MAISATQIRRGMVIVFNGEPCKVVEFRHHTPGNLRRWCRQSFEVSAPAHHLSIGFVRRPGRAAALEQHEMEYLYSDGSHHHFMNTENYEQTALSEEELGDAAQWLMPGLRLQAEFYEGAPIELTCRLRWN